jgi:hypothetical protein
MPRSRSLHRFALCAALAFVVAACTSKPTPIPPGPGGTINAIKQNAAKLSLLQAQSELTVGTSLFTYGLVTSKGELVQGGAPQVWAATGLSSKALGPFASTFYSFTADQEFKDNAPKSPLTGFYVAQVDIPNAGNWTFAAVASNGSTKAVGVGAMKVVQTAAVAPIGSKAISVKTPVATTTAKLKEIDTRDPPSTMHYISLDKALKNGKPTVVVFSTPLLCESMMCGPVTDEVYKVFKDVGAAKANFIHVEEFLPGPDLTPPAPTPENQSPRCKARHLLTEPWTFVIDSQGIIRSSFEGPVVAQEIEAALQPLLTS